MMMRLPWLHPQRTEVLAALALSVRVRQPLAEGFARLAAVDPTLQPWQQRLDGALRAGDPLGSVLYRYRLVDRRDATRLDTADDPLVAFEAVARESHSPLHGLWLIRWFPVPLMLAVCLPLALLKMIGVAQIFEDIFLGLGIKLPTITLMVLDHSAIGVWLLVLVGVWMAGILIMLSAIRGLRHVPRLWWVEVQRSAALLALATAARAAADEPVRLTGLLAWLAKREISAWRQGRPAWDREWRTYHILTCWRAPGPGWQTAAHALTALEVLRSLDLVDTTCDAAGLECFVISCRERLRHALVPAHAQAWALLMVGFAVGCLASVFALYLPLISVTEQLG